MCFQSEFWDFKKQTVLLDIIFYHGKWVDRFISYSNPKSTILNCFIWAENDILDLKCFCVPIFQFFVTTGRSWDKSISTPELFSFAHDWGREELWGTLEQASFSLVFAKNKEHAHDWLIQMKSLLIALLCERRQFQICEEGKAFWSSNFQAF